MRERPILFSAPMVRAILEGRKTQTRRVVKPGPPPCQTNSGAMHSYRHGWRYTGVDYACERDLERCPYGEPGDRLWVREPWWKVPEPSIRQLRDGADTWPKRFAYVADGDDPETVRQWGWKWLPPMFMPRSAARILLEITDVRVQRLQDISCEDISAEGVETLAAAMWGSRWFVGASDAIVSAARRDWFTLWDSISGADAHKANPWVWAITFKRVEAAECAA